MKEILKQPDCLDINHEMLDSINNGSLCPICKKGTVTLLSQSRNRKGFCCTYGCRVTMPVKSEPSCDIEHYIYHNKSVAIGDGCIICMNENLCPRYNIIKILLIPVHYGELIVQPIDKFDFMTNTAIFVNDFGKNIELICSRGALDITCGNDHTMRLFIAKPVITEKRITLKIFDDLLKPSPYLLRPNEK